MKPHHLVNIEKLTKEDRFHLGAAAADIYRSQEKILKVQASYEGKIHTRLDRIILELNEALGDLHDLIKI